MSGQYRLSLTCLYNLVHVQGEIPDIIPDNCF